MKIALCFLVYNKIECEKIWETWLNGNEDKVSIYIHSKYPFSTESPLFKRLAIHVETIPTEWGGWGLVEATGILFRSALEDPTNERFILLSDKCIPVKKFDYTYNFLKGNNKSYIFESPQFLRFPKYNKLLEFTENYKIAKHAQWINLIRVHAQELISNLYNIEMMYKNVHVPDESWALTWLNMKNMGGVCNNYESTYKFWKNGGGDNPETFNKISLADLRKIILGPHLFARKFVSGSKLSDNGGESLIEVMCKLLKT